MLDFRLDGSANSTREPIKVRHLRLWAPASDIPNKGPCRDLGSKLVECSIDHCTMSGAQGTGEVPDNGGNGNLRSIGDSLR